METVSTRCLINSISRFIHLMTCQTSKGMPSRKEFESMASTLKHLKPILDEINDDMISSDENLRIECEGLDMSVHASREFVERWSPKMSRILTVLQSEQLLTKIKRCSLEICGILSRLLQTSPASSSLAGVQHCVQELQSWESERISKHIEHTVKSKNGILAFYSEHIEQIVESLDLVSSQELLKESIAVEKASEKPQANKCKEEMDRINLALDLLVLIREHFLKTGCLGTMDGVSIPSHFRCPLSLDFMWDPVIVASGQTFERSSIQKWLDHGLRICPKTRQYLSHTNLIPNYTVKALIANWLEQNHLKLTMNSDSSDIHTKASVSDDLSSQDIIPADSFLSSTHSVEAKSDEQSPGHSYTHSRTQSVSSAVSCSDYVPSERKKLGAEINETGKSNNARNCSLPSSNSGYDDTITSADADKLVEDLKSPSYILQASAAAEVRLLAKHNMDNRMIIGKCGAIGPLISLLHSYDQTTQEHAVTALLNLSLNEENKRSIGEYGVIEPLIHVLETGTNAAKENSAAALFSLSVLEEYKVKIGRSGAVKALVDLLAHGTVRGKKDAATALFNLSICHENRARIVQAGAAKCLVELLDPCRGMVDKSVALLANLSTISEGRSAIAREGGIPLLVEIVDCGSQRGKENAAAVLLELCLNSTKFCNMVLQEGAIPPLVALSQSGTSRAKDKAQQLLGHFRSQREALKGKKRS